MVVTILTSLPHTLQVLDSVDYFIPGGDEWFWSVILTVVMARHVEKVGHILDETVDILVVGYHRFLPV